MSATPLRIVRLLATSAAALLGALFLAVFLHVDSASAAEREAPAGSSGSLLGFVGETVGSVTQPVGDLVGGVVATVAPTPAAPVAAAPVPAAPAPAPAPAPVAATPAVPAPAAPAPLATQAAAVVTPVITGVTGTLGAVAGVVDETLASAPVSGIVTPVADLVDGTLAVTGVTSLPILGPVLGHTPVGSIVDPVTGLVDGVLGDTGAALSPVLQLPGTLIPDALAPVVTPAGPSLDSDDLPGLLAPSTAVQTGLPEQSGQIFAERAAMFAALGSLAAATTVTAAADLPGVASAFGLDGAPGAPGAPATPPALGGAAVAAVAALGVAILTRRQLLVPALRGGHTTDGDDDLPSSPVFEADSFPD